MAKQSQEPESDTPLLDEVEQGAALLHEMAEKVAFWTMVAGHLMMRLEAVGPESAITITPKFRNLALGLPLQMGMSEDETGTTYYLYVDCASDKPGLAEVRRDELSRRDVNGLNKPILDAYIAAAAAKLQERIDRRGSGIYGPDGKEIPATGIGSGPTTVEPRTTGEVS